MPGPPVIIEQPQSLTVTASDSADFSVAASGDQATYDQLLYQWFLNGTVVAGATDPTLTIADAQAANVGGYTVVISNSLGAVTSVVATLTVTPEPPLFTSQPGSQSVLVGTSAAFSASAAGTEPITYQWQLNGSDLLGQTNTSLILTKPGYADSGAYQLVAKNAAGTTVSQQANLTFSTVLAWGGDDYGQTNVPAGLSNVVQISAGVRHNLALLRDGTVIAWGSGLQTNVPPGLSGAIAVAAGGNQSLAVKNDGTVIAWGDDTASQINPPPGLTNVIAVSAGATHSLALRADGRVAAWGLDYNGPGASTDIGLSNMVAISAGSNFSLALRIDGTITAWGDNNSRQLMVPLTLTNVVAIAAGAYHCLALKADGGVVAWGNNQYGQADVPPGLDNVVAIAAGRFHSLALRADGSVVGWGAGNSTSPQPGQAAVPAGLGGIATIAAGWTHSLVLAGDGPPFITTPPVGGTLYRDSQVVFHASANGALPLNFQWQFAGTNLPGATGPALLLCDATNSGNYQVVVSNALGVATSAPATLVLVGQSPTVQFQPASQIAYLGCRLHLQVVVGGSKPLSYQWRFNDEDLPAATNASLTLANLTFGQSGLYSVLVSNPYGVVSSAKAIVQVSQVAAWGDNRYGQTNVPPALVGVMQVTGGNYHSLALRADGSVVAWGATGFAPGFPYITDFGQTSVPADLTNAVAVAAGGYHSLALRADGTVVCWGDNTAGQAMVPAGLTEVVAIAAGEYHSAALTSDGHVVVWGGQPSNVPVTSVPPNVTNIVAIAAIADGMLALKADGSVIGWGAEAMAMRFPPNLVALGSDIALRGDGRVISPAAPPPGLFNVVQIAGGGYGQFLALRSDGTVVTWGSTEQFGLSAVAGILTNAIAIGCGLTHSLAALGDGSVQITVQPCDRKVDLSGNTLLSVVAVGAPPLSYQWRLNGVDLSAATNFWLRRTNLQLADAGGYSVVVGNSSQTVTSRLATLVVRSPTLPPGPALGGSGLTWITGGNATWFAQTNITHDGIGAAQSGAIGDSQQSVLQTTVSGPGTLSFWWKVSSEQRFDLLTFAISGQVQTNISGEVDWQFQQFPVPAGTVSLTWTYAKDPTLSVDMDAGWLDQVTYVTNPPVIIRQPISQVVPMGTNVVLSIVATGAPPLLYQWLKSGTNLTGATGSSLVFSNATRRDSGIYEVAVSNPGGTVMSSNAQVLVRVRQKLGLPVWLPQGGLMLLSLDADGQPLFSNHLSGFQAEVSTNLLDWTTLPNSFVLTNGALLLVDPAATKYSQRFYRVYEP